MKKFDRKFIKYSITLFVVSVLLISIGAVSLTRSSERTDKVYMENASAKNRIEVLSNENLLLKKEIELLKKENENLSKTSEKYLALTSIYEAQAMIEGKDYENALICLEKIDKNILDGYGLENYEKLYEIVKENIKWLTLKF